MANEVVVKDNKFSQAISELGFIHQFMGMISKSPHYSKLGQDGIFAILCTAQSLGIHPMRAFNNGLYYLKGKVGMYTELMASLIREHGHSVTKDKDSNDSICTLHGKRSDNGDMWTVSYSIDDAKKAGLWRDNYEKQPGVMIYNRAMSQLARQLFPDVIQGVGYSKDEVDDIVEQDSKKTKDLNNLPLAEADICQSDTPQVDQKPKNEPEKIPTINNAQIEQLTKLLSQCPQKYQDSVWKNLDKMNIGAYDEINIELFERIRTAAIKTRDESLASKMDENQEGA